MSRVTRFLEFFWWRMACPQPDGRFNCWLQGKPYAWTARLHTPWYWLNHPRERWRMPRFPWTRAVLSILLIPVGIAIWAGGRVRLPRRRRLVLCGCGIPHDQPGHGNQACTPCPYDSIDSMAPTGIPDRFGPSVVGEGESDGR